MKLTILERIVISRFLPQKGNYEELKTSEVVVRPQISFNEEELRKYDIISKADEHGRQMINFNKESTEGYEKEISFPPIIYSLISGKLKDLSIKRELEIPMLSVYEKFVLHPVPIVEAQHDS